ncbi:MAG: hypothetical protein GY829_11010 [Gammaproteobacteria bacterium]|nr:hypothetical protein [Gammaproteobacteria bacterium]
MRLLKSNSFNKGLIGLFCLLFTSFAFADYKNHPHKLKDNSFRIFSSYESNGQDYIQGIGIGIINKNKITNFELQLNTSFNNAEIMATDGYQEDFFAWQGSVKFGYFSNAFVYGEAGLDLTEVLFHELRYDDNEDYYHDDKDDGIDAFFGLGVGLQAGPITVEAFTRVRKIDSRNWEAESEVFTGFQLSLNF